MIVPDTSGWTRIADTINSSLWQVELLVIAIVPRLGVADDGATARANLQGVNDYFQRVGPGGIVVFYDLMVSQDAEARRVYTQPNPLLRGAALVGGNLLSRAMMSFFLGFSRPATPTKVFGDIPAAIEFVRAVVRTDR